MTLFVIGHRGDGVTNLSNTYAMRAFTIEHRQPENTLSAFEKALKQGADGFELDIMLSKDGVPMVIHDAELNKHVWEANKSALNLGRVGEKTAAELQAFVVGPGGETIPTLEQVLELVIQYHGKRPSDTPPLIVNIELKDPFAHTAVLQLLQDHAHYAASRDILISSFNREQLAEIRADNSTIKLGLFLQEGETEQQLAQDIERIRPASLHAEARASVRLVALAQQYNCAALVWFEHEKQPKANAKSVQQLLEALQNSGITCFICTDYPAQMRALVKSAQKKTPGPQLTDFTLPAATPAPHASSPAAQL